MQSKVSLIKESVKTAIHGKNEIIDMVLCTMLAGGHVLLEDIPGVGKTTLVTAIAKVSGLDYKRVQFTPDVLPGDIVGFSMINKLTNQFEFKEGSVYTNFFLADEINRTSPRTQSALLEVMEEGKATVDGVTRKVPSPFFVIATQNPFGASGTQKLPDSQLDRFMVRLSMGYPNHESAKDILRHDSHDVIAEMNNVVNKEELISMQNEVKNVRISEELLDYIVSLTEATRNNKDFSIGLSPRGSIALTKMAKAWAYINDRDYCIPEDLRTVFIPVANHRVVLSSFAKSNGASVNQSLMTTFESVKIK